MGRRKASEDGEEDFDRVKESSFVYTEHPLFPLEEGQKPFDVSYISLARKEDGAMKWVPQVFSGEELTSEQNIIERWGGGQYELYARASSKKVQGQPGNITKRRMISLPGRPKPIDPSNASAAEERAAGINQPAPAAPAGVFGGGDSGVLVAILQMNQAQAAQAAQQSQNFMALMMQMMNESRKDAAVTSSNMMQMFTQMSASSQQQMMQLLPLLIQQKGGGPEELAKYVEMMKALGLTKAPEVTADGTAANESVGAMLENAADIVAGVPAMLGALKSLAPGGGPPTGNSPIEQRSMAAAAVPGSAASVMLGTGGGPRT